MEEEKATNYVEEEEVKGARCGTFLRGGNEREKGKMVAATTSRVCA